MKVSQGATSFFLRDAGARTKTVRASIEWPESSGSPIERSRSRVAAIFNAHVRYAH
jgi:hypothetical protein